MSEEALDRCSAFECSYSKLVVISSKRVLITLVFLASSFVWVIEGKTDESVNPADLNADAQVDLQDFLILKSNMGVANTGRKSKTCEDGDANGDGRVNNLDVDILWENYGMVSGATCEQGDFDGDGDVDGNDFLLYQQNYTGDSVPGACVTCQDGDFNGDGRVGVLDSDIWTENYPIESGATCEQGDIDGDGDVDGNDFLILETKLGLGPVEGELNGDCIVDVWDLDILRAEMGFNFEPPSGLTSGSLSLMISSDGTASLANSGGVAIAFDSISIFSKSGSLSPEGWESIEFKTSDDPTGVSSYLGEGALGFQEASSTTNLLTEVASLGEARLPVSGSFNIGRPYRGHLADASSDLQLFYTEANVVKEGEIKVFLSIADLERRSDGGLTIHWAGADLNVEIQSKVTLDETEWKTVTDSVTGTSWNIQPVGNSQFFRIVIP